MLFRSDNQTNVNSLGASSDEYRNLMKVQKYKLRQSHLNEQRSRLEKIEAKMNLLTKTKISTISNRKSDSSDTSFNFEKGDFQNPKKENLYLKQIEEDNLHENTGSTNDYCDFEEANLNEFDLGLSTFAKDSPPGQKKTKLFKTAPLETFIFF